MELLVTHVELLVTQIFTKFIVNTVKISLNRVVITYLYYQYYLFTYLYSNINADLNKNIQNYSNIDK